MNGSDRTIGNFDGAGGDRPTGLLSGSAAGLSVEHAQILDEACDAFEGKWKGRGRPDILAALLELPESLRPVALRELIHLDVHYRRRRGEIPAAADYTGRFPGLDADWLAGVIPGDDEHHVLRPGGRIGGFVLLSELGRGGMGVVWLARQHGLNREVALKMLLAGPFASPALRAQFLVEAESIAVLEHPHVVKVFEFGEHAGLPYLAMEYLPRGTLADRVKVSGPLPCRESAELVAKLASAVAHAHSKPVVHRDIKPGNVLFGSDGEPRLADFGLAKVGWVEQSLGTTGRVLGTASYMAPEQAAGKLSEVSNAADVYALGAVLYEMLAGRPPFRGDTRVATLQKVMTEEPLRPRDVVPTVDRDLEAVCLKCLQKDPGERYASATALADDIDRYLRHEPTLARPVGPIDRVRLWVRRNRGLTWALGSVAAALVSGAAVAVAFGIDAHEARKLAETRGKAVADANTQLREHVSQLRLEAYPNDVRLAHEAWRSGDRAAARAVLDRYRPQDGQTDLRGFEWYYLDGLLQDTERVLTRHHAPLLTADVSPDGTLVASGDESGLVKVTELATGREVRAFRYANKEVTCVRFSPDGQWLATAGGDQTVRLWNVLYWSGPQCLAGHDGTVTCVAWHPYSDRIATSGRDRHVKIWDVWSGACLQDIVHPDVVRCVAWSKRDTLSTGCADGLIRTGDPDGETLRTWTQRDGGALAQAFSPDGKKFASGGYSRTVRVFNMVNTSYRWLVRSADNIWSLAFHPDNRYLIVGGEHQIQMYDAFQMERWPLRTWECGGRARAVAFTPGGRHVVSAIEGPNEVRVRETPPILGYTHVVHRRPTVTYAPAGDWVARLQTNSGIELVGGAPRRRARTLRDHTQAGIPLVFTSRGDQLLTTDTGRTVTAWDTATATRLRVVLPGKLGTQRLAVSPDGAWVAGINRDGETHVASLATGELVKSLPGRGKDDVWREVEFSPDGATLATAACGVVTLWRAGTWERLAELREGRSVQAVTFSPDGRILATAGNSHGVILWDVGTGRELARLRGHEGWAISVAFSPDGRTLATADEDDTVRLWHVATRRELFTLYHHFSDVHWVRFAPGGRLQVCGSGAQAYTCGVYTFPPGD